MASAFIFPGQGSQAVGMGKALAEQVPASRAVFEEVDDALGEPLSRLIFEGPEAELTLTRNAQPALLAVSMAALAALRERGVTVERHAAYVAGHSLGEYTALAAAGSIALADAAVLLRTRGEAMQSAVPEGQGAMAALLGLDFEAAREVAREAEQGEVCAAANDNAPGQVVVSGSREAVARAVGIAKAHGARRAMMLSVSAPFHCALMSPAAEVMAEALARVAIHPPVVPLVSNVLASALTDPTQIRQRLVEQVTGTVRWRESVAWLAGEGVGLFVEIGAGKVLTGLVRRIAPDADAIAVGTPEEADAAAARLAT
ncbi:ACP S-malonyltransferase [Propylenella binzhouense]|uniref:Malonyl CoA-acyl carrier protein transacylase n=1 Tax=Propylenella binzhouense TaxID=2555902 RepID=A0A964T4W8_9HYPH|nr:ACP S-malonyltransferase [Propylenella binzhouense]MYZ48414.1 ACP S-malonyltransferase [Propylenella binzhouense]